MLHDQTSVESLKHFFLIFIWKVESIESRHVTNMVPDHLILNINNMCANNNFSMYYYIIKQVYCHMYFKTQKSIQLNQSATCI